MTNPNDNDLTRRATLVAGVASTTALAEKKMIDTSRMPVVFLPHGGGPWPWMSEPFGDPAELSELSAFLKSVAQAPKTKPKAILAVSAHWEESVPTVMTSTKPPMFYDYYGFPPETYQITWPAPGSPHVARRVGELLTKAGIKNGTDAERGFDHGTFVPLKLTYPNAEIPTLQLSLKRGLDPAEHLKIGQALAPLRDEGVFIVGSGMTYHNLRAFGPHAAPVAAAFDSWLQTNVTLPQPERDTALTRWASAPAARAAHPREEHLIPLMVAAGAAGADRASVAYAGSILDLRISAYRFG